MDFNYQTIMIGTFSHSLVFCQRKTSKKQRPDWGTVALKVRDDRAGANKMQ